MIILTYLTPTTSFFFESFSFFSFFFSTLGTISGKGLFNTIVFSIF